MIYTTSDNVNIYYEMDGTGPTIILLNGLWGDTTSWSNQLTEFSEHFSCIRVDHRGIARSDRWIGQYSYELHARDILELIDHLKVEKCSLLGTCHGGMVATTFAINYQDRVNSLAINGVQLLKSVRQSQVYAGWRMILENAGFKTLYKSMIIPSIMSEGFLSHNKDKIENIVNTTLQRIDKGSALGLIEAARNYGYDPETIEQIQIPAMIMAGNEDLFSPPYIVENIRKLWKNSEYYLFKDCGHFPQRESTKEYNKIVLNYLIRTNL